MIKTGIVALIFVLFLYGCTYSPPETASVETTAPAVQMTTEPVIEQTTEPTEPVPSNYFEENEIRLWEHGSAAYYRWSKEARNLLPSEDIQAQYPPDVFYQDCVYAFTEDRSQFFSDQINTYLDVFIREIPSENFMAYDVSKKGVNHNYTALLFDLYKKEVDPDITLEAWIEQYRDYKIIATQAAHIMMSEDFAVITQNNKTGNFWSRPESSCVIDKYSGNVLQLFNKNIALRSFTVNYEGKETECWVACQTFSQPFDYYHALHGGKIYRNQRRTFFEQYSILVPKDYDGIIMGFCNTEEPLLSAEEFYTDIDGTANKDTTDEETSDWWYGSMYEYLENLEADGVEYRIHYWGMLPRGAVPDGQ